MRPSRVGAKRGHRVKEELEDGDVSDSTQPPYSAKKQRGESSVKKEGSLAGADELSSVI